MNTKYVVYICGDEHKESDNTECPIYVPPSGGGG